MQDLLDEKILRKKIMAAMEPKRQSLRPYAKDPMLDLHSIDRGVPSPTATGSSRTSPTPQQIVWDALDNDRLVLFEGAQGALLDIDHGTYPFVTSSNTVRGAACAGAGVGPEGHQRGLGRRQGLLDARRRRARSRPSSTTRSGDKLREAGGEYGTTTGRPRRCGWLDLVALKYAARINGLTGL